MNGKKRSERMTVSIPLNSNERTKLEAICGPHRRIKRGEWVREAILEKLARDAGRPA